MKRMIALAVLAAFVLGTVGTASAIVDVKASGSWRVSANWISGQDLLDNGAATDNGQSEFDIAQRVRTAFQFIANENLRGVWHVEIGTANWGQDNGFDLGMDIRSVIEVKQAYIDFMIPNTEINIMAGGLPLALPSGAVGSPVFDDDVAALIMSTPLFDGVGLLAGYARLGTMGTFGDGGDANTEYIDTELDAWVLAVPMNFEWLSLTPYTMFAYSGNRWLDNVTNNETSYAAIPAGLVSQNASLNGDGYAADDGDVSVWWGGMAFGLNLDPVVIDGHFVYGNLDGPNNLERAGWEADLALTYTGFDFMTPRLVFMWTSGEDGNASEDDGESERLPVVSPSQASTKFWDGGGVIGDGSDTLSGASDAAQVGYWTLGLEINDVSFIDKLTHDFSVYYIEGTNDESIGTQWNQTAAYSGQGATYGMTLTDDDSMWEYVMRTEYKMYDQLRLILELGYLDVDFDESNWTATSGDAGDEDASKVLLGVRYDF